MSANPVSPASLRQNFLRRLDPESGFHRLWDYLPGVSFFAKDRESRLVAANRFFYERFGLRSEDELVGKSDYDLFPARLAEHFRRDDQEVIASRQPKLNIVELFFNPQGIPDWFVTHKLPLFDRTGEIVGLMGISQSYTVSKKVLQPYLAIDRAVNFIREHFRERITVEQLAEHVHLSPRQLHRKFVEAFGSSPHDFIMKVRLQAACEILQNGDQLIGDIARETGFLDASSFTQHFRRHMGLTPLKYQRQFRRLGA